jgi:probable phosphoglycerate mutase
VAGALGLPVAYDDDLVELDFGDLEGLTLDEAMAKHPLATRRFMADVSVAAPGGESIAQVSARVARARARLLGRHAGRTVLVVSHVTPIKLFLTAALAAADSAVHRVFLEAASFCTVAWSSDGRASVRLVNDTAHLR